MRDSLVFDLIHVIGKQFLDGAAIELGELRQLVGTRLRKTSLPLAHGRGLYANGLCNLLLANYLWLLYLLYTLIIPLIRLFVNYFSQKYRESGGLDKTTLRRYNQLRGKVVYLWMILVNASES